MYVYICLYIYIYTICGFRAKLRLQHTVGDCTKAQTPPRNPNRRMGLSEKNRVPYLGSGTPLSVHRHLGFVAFALMRLGHAGHRTKAQTWRLYVFVATS